MGRQQFTRHVSEVMDAQHVTWQEAVTAVATQLARAELGPREVIPDA